MATRVKKRRRKQEREGKGRQGKEGKKVRNRTFVSVPYFVLRVLCCTRWCGMLIKVRCVACERKGEREKERE